MPLPALALLGPILQMVPGLIPALGKGEQAQRNSKAAEVVVQFDVVPKHAQGFIQVFYQDQPASDLIPWETHKSCFENLMIVDIQLAKPLPR